jgi:protoporphyrinogen oxidase
MKIAVIGAGLAGLTSANILSEYGEVIVFEKFQPGGLASSYITDKGAYIEKFYHHCFRNDDVLIEMIKDLSLGNKLVWKVAKVAYAHDGSIFPLNTPFEILNYPFLSIRDKIKLALFTLKSRKRDYRMFDDVGVVEGIKRELGDRILEEFFTPLLRSKFGENYQDVSFAWLLGRVSVRSNRKLSGEELGYIKGGFHQLIEKMADNIDIRVGDYGIRRGHRFEVNGDEFDAVIFTAPIPELNDDLRRAANIPEIRYQSSICALIGSERKITENIYWTNVKESRTFGAIIEHTNFMDVRDYGEEIIYLASYSTPEGELFKKSEDELKKLYLRDLKDFGLEERDINWIKIFKAKYSGPIFERGYARKITHYRTSLKNFYIAGMTSPPNYPERSMNGSIRSGIEVAKAVKEDFEFD